MTRNLRRTAALLALPLVLSFGLAACGDDTSADKAGKGDKAAAAPTTDLPTSASDLPDPRKDPQAFQAYLTGIYEKSGLSKKQASCMSKAYMDNVDVTKLDDQAAVTAAMNSQELQDAVVDCMS
jgi:hypothetical protein